ncbi:AAA family ATPase [Ornithinimicrobium cavernae]|uniref:AAA family ATPase n=1 Tax=Ornithinimicrobium cavernae TaxID=2666047 RepID=UPI000D693913|nr:hypothetical protein [Ornithinimicrobium cavernae]
MAVITLTSASGSPGVTTTAVGLALSWARRTILLDADPTGGSSILAGYLRGQMVPPDALVELVVAQQQGRLRSTIPTVTMPLPESQVSLIPGPRAHHQAHGLTGLWDHLLAALKDLAPTGQDTIIDLGRLGLSGSAMPLLYGSDLALVVCRSDLVSLSGARSWVSTLRSEFEQLGAANALGVLLVGPGNPYAADEVSKVLGVPVTAALDWDPRAAAAFSAGASARKLSTSPLVRSLRGAAGVITRTVEANRAHLVGDATPEAS